LGNNQGNFLLHRFNASKNIANRFSGYFFDSHFTTKSNIVLYQKSDVTCRLFNTDENFVART